MVFAGMLHIIAGNLVIISFVKENCDKNYAARAFHCA
jgi:hypothetical protein